MSGFRYQKQSILTESLIDSKPILVQAVARRPTGNKSFSETMITQSTDAYVYV